MKIINDKNPEKVRELAVTRINEFLQQNFEKKILFLTSGGSCLDLLDGILAENLSSNITFALIDERFTTNPENNNYQKLLSKKDFIRKISVKNSVILDTAIREGETAEEFSKRYEQLISAWKENNPNGVVFATFGVGIDGHTAGVLPMEKEKFEKLFVKTSRNFIDYEVENPDFKVRVTSTLKFLKENISAGIVYQVKKDSKELWEKILQKTVEMNEIPAMIFHELKNIDVFHDLNSI